MTVSTMLSDARGGILIFVAGGLVAFLGFVALVIDMGYGLVTRTELQNVSDAAALAGTRQLGRVYEGLTFAAQPDYVLTTADREAIIARILDVAQKNRAGGKSISIAEADIKIGRWNLETRSLTVTDTIPDAVQVMARRDAAANGPIPTFFGRVLGVDALDVSTRATAAMTGIRYVPPGELDLPTGISKQWFVNHESGFCGESIQFYPTGTLTGCAGWSTFDEGPANANTLRDILRGLLPDPPTYVPPEATAYSTEYEFIGGNIANALKDVQNLFNARKVRNPLTGIYEWKTFVFVYEDDDCSNPSGPLTIVGFSTVIITEVLAPPQGQLIRGTVMCNAVDHSRGGGAAYGTSGAIPGLVQ